MRLLDYNSFYLVGIKGVAMTSLAQCLLDSGKKVRGADVDEEFVTQDLLNDSSIVIDIGFDHQIPDGVDCLIFTAAHQGQNNPLVVQAQNKNIKCLSQAEALAELFNAQKGLAVCGVGGKSTISAMLTWIFTQTKQDVSFSVGVGGIAGLEKTGQYSSNAQYFIAEADEYVINPGSDQPIARFSFLKPFLTVCSNLKFDHPDVYKDFNHTKATFLKFFNQIENNGFLIINNDDSALVELLSQVKKSIKILTVGTNPSSDLKIVSSSFIEGESRVDFSIGKEKFQLKLLLPGIYNLKNGLMAILAAKQLGIDIQTSIQALATFRSTKRRFEYLGEIKGVKYYDDYAHHPDEVAVAIRAMKDWFPDRKIWIAFQPHTYSRTKVLFDQFVDSLLPVDHLILVNIFASARESTDPNVSSLQLKHEIEKKTNKKVELVSNYSQLAEKLITLVKPNDVVLTLGAGDIYKAHGLMVNG